MINDWSRQWYKGYIPTRQATLDGGYDGPEPFYKTMLPVSYAPGIKDIIVDSAVQLALRAISVR